MVDAPYRVQFVDATGEIAFTNPRDLLRLIGDRQAVSIKCFA
jgi:hypothetical protein